MSKAPSIDGNELTDKGCIDERTAWQRRAVLVQRVYARTPARARFMCQQTPGTAAARPV